MNDFTHNKGVIYVCPMCPGVESDKPGRCPECGMNLIENRKQEIGNKNGMNDGRSRHSDFNKHAGHHTADFLKKFWISLVLTIPVVLYSDLPSALFGWSAPAFAGSEYLQFVIGSIIFFYGGWVFLSGAVKELRAKLPGMMTLIGIAITTAYAWSVWEIIVGESHTLFWELATLITIMLLGHWVEMKSVQSAQGALKELSKLLPDTAEVVSEISDRGQETRIVPLAELKEGNLVFVRPGGKIPADGRVVEGRSDVNESLMTGESKPVAKVIGSDVIAGSLNGDGSLKIRITKIGEHTFLAGVMRLVEEAQASKSRLQILSDKAAYLLTIVAVSVGAITLIIWIVLGQSFSFAVERLVAVLVVACPHALGLAVPLVAAISTTLAARNGFLVRNRLSLELARKIDVVLFDKTGTLTTGEYGVEKVISLGRLSEEEILRLAAGVDSHSEHFISRAIVTAAQNRGLKIPDAANFKRLPGRGVSAEVEGKKVLVGGESIVAEAESIPDEAKARAKELSRGGETVIYLLVDGVIAGLFSLADIVRPESKEAMAALKRAGVKAAMVTGDSEEVARWVAEELDLDEFYARILPEKKASKVKELQARGLKVAMVGDGINDAPALAQADLGIAIGAGTNVAIESAGIILVKNDPRDIPKIIKLSRLTYRKMLQNLFWAAGYNIVAIPLAAGVLVARGILLQPALSAVFMSLSTVIVAVNALFLKRAKM